MSIKHIGDLANPTWINSYVNLLFEQDWGMFSNLPKGNSLCFVKYISNENPDNNWYDLTTPLYKRNTFLLSIDQRLSKYLDGTTQGILARHSEAVSLIHQLSDSLDRNKYIEEYVIKSYPYKSLIQYSKIPYKKIHKTKDENVMIQIMFVYEPLIPYSKRYDGEIPVVRRITLPPTYLFK